MRAWYFTVPAGVLLATLGVVMVLEAQGPVVKTGYVVSSEPRHLVTPDMVRRTSAETQKPAPEFQTVGFDGTPVALGEGRTKPQFVYFIMDGCPCSIEAEGLFHELNKHFKSQVDFVGVINTGKDKARQWSVDMLTPYPVVPDPDEKIIHAFGATNSAVSALVKDGRIVKMWPGFSIDLMKDMNSTIAETVGVAATPIDTKWAPIKRAAGCAF